MPYDFAFTPIPPARGTLRSDVRKPAAVAALTGNWRGEMVLEGSGEHVPFTLLRDGSSDAAVAGRFLFFATRDVAPTGMKLLEASNRTFVALVGPYYCPREDADVMTIFEGVRDGSQLHGTFYTRVQNWRYALRSGEFTAALADASTRAA
ncbi:MAG: hypothetical protein ABIZ91_13130 [Gemmatimonadaceae bacterium]